MAKTQFCTLLMQLINSSALFSPRGRVGSCCPILWSSTREYNTNLSSFLILCVCVFFWGTTSRSSQGYLSTETTMGLWVDLRVASGNTHWGDWRGNSQAPMDHWSVEDWFCFLRPVMEKNALLEANHRKIRNWTPCICHGKNIAHGVWSSIP